MLEVVEHEQAILHPQVVCEAHRDRLAGNFVQAERLGNGHDDGLRVADGREADEADTVCELLANLLGDCEGKPRLADAARSSKREQPSGSQQAHQRRAEPTRRYHALVDSASHWERIAPPIISKWRSIEEAYLMSVAKTKYDVIVVGGRCAGSPTAMLLARRGYRLLLVDRASFPSDTIRAHFIRLPGVRKLAEWCLLDRVLATNCPPIRNRRTIFGDFPLKGSPPWPEGVPGEVAPRRKVLDKILVDAAVAAGAELREHHPVEDLLSTALSSHGRKIYRFSRRYPVPPSPRRSSC